MTSFYKCLLIAAVAMAMPGAATAQAGLAIAQQAPAVAVVKKDRIICRRDREFDTGSHLRASKRCLKASEWKEREDSSERFMRSVDDRSGVRDIPRGELEAMSPQPDP